MALATYSDLQTSAAELLHRTGDASVTSLLPDWIALAEAEMQVELKTVEFESTATVTITSGVGTLPTDYVGMRSVYWDGSSDYPLTYVSPAEFDKWREETSGDGLIYTISGSTIRTAPAGDGSVVMTYHAKFTALSDSNTSNSILTNHPQAYLYGTLKHACVWALDDEGMKKYGVLFNAAMERIKTNSQDRKYGGSLAVRAG